MSFGGSGNISVHDKYVCLLSPAAGQSPTANRSNTAIRGAHSFFSLKSFSYACSGGVPQPECAVSMWGFRGGSLVAHRVINFPALDPGHFPHEFVMNSTTFDWRWSRLSSVGFSIARADNGGMMYGGLMIDNFRYTIEGECKGCGL